MKKYSILIFLGLFFSCDLTSYEDEEIVKIEDNQSKSVESIIGNPNGEPMSVLSFSSNDYWLFHRGNSNSTIYARSSSSPLSVPFTDEGTIPGNTSHLPEINNYNLNGLSSVVFNNKAFVYHRGDNNEKIYVTNSNNGINWSASTEINTVNKTKSNVEAVVFKNTVYLFHTGENNFNKMYYASSSDGINFVNKGILNNVSIANYSSAGAVVWTDPLGDEELLVFYPSSLGQIRLSRTKNGINWTHSIFSSPLPPYYLSDEYIGHIEAAYFNGKVILFVWTDYGRMYYTSNSTPTTNNWPGYSLLVTSCEGPPSSIVADNKILVAYQGGLSSSGQYLYYSTNGLTWNYGGTLGGQSKVGPTILYTGDINVSPGGGGGGGDDGDCGPYPCPIGQTYNCDTGQCEGGQQ